MLAANLPIKTAFKLKGVANKVADELDKYDKLRLEMITKYADKDEKGNIALEDNGHAKFSSDGLRKFIDNLNELGSVDVDIPAIHISELDGLDNFTGEDFVFLGDLIDA